MVHVRLRGQATVIMQSPSGLPLPAHNFILVFATAQVNQELGLFCFCISHVTGRAVEATRRQTEVGQVKLVSLAGREGEQIVQVFTVHGM